MKLELPHRALGAVLLFFFLIAPGVTAADYPEPASGDYTLHQFRFASGEELPELRIHYRTLGEPQRDKDGVVTNAVLILHGTSEQTRGHGTHTLAAVWENNLREFLKDTAAK
jgi:homoserine acetyltransferase